MHIVCQEVDRVMDTRLRKARLKRGETTYEVAAKVGVSQAQYHRVETGMSGASRELAERLARHFGDAVTEMEILYPERYVETLSLELQAAS
jgi:transcriptional regulator with XRE-family HTH domain